VMAAVTVSPKTVRLNLQIATGAVVCQEANLVGEISIGEGTVVHPKANIIAEAGPIIIGKNNIIEEQTTIRNSWPEDATEEQKKTKRTMNIGDNNVFEVGCLVEADRIGKCNVVESKTFLSKGCILGDGCVIVASYRMPPSTLEDNTVIYGIQGKKRVVQNAQETHLATHAKHLEILWKTLPGFHHLRKSQNEGT